jgi:hypothetical protein
MSNEEKMHAVADKFCVFIQENFVHDGDAEEVLRKTIRPSNDLTTDDLPSGTIEVMTELLSASGFRFIKLVPGVAEKPLRRSRRKLSPHNTPRPERVNRRCPVKVQHKTRSGKTADHYTATGWLDQAYGVGRSGSDDAIATLVRQLARSRSYESPIQLNDHGECLVKILPEPEITNKKVDYFAEPIRDADEIKDLIVGLHEHCGGEMRRIEVSETHDALACQGGCNLRVVFERSEVETYADLRTYFANNS